MTKSKLLMLLAAVLAMLTAANRSEADRYYFASGQSCMIEGTANSGSYTSKGARGETTATTWVCPLHFSGTLQGSTLTVDVFGRDNSATSHYDGAVVCTATFIQSTSATITSAYRYACGDNGTRAGLGLEDAAESQNQSSFALSDAYLRVKRLGAQGNSYTMSFVPNAVSPNESLTRSGNAFTFHYQAGVTTLAKVVSVFGTSAELELWGDPNLSAVVQSNDSFSNASFGGGADPGCAAVPWIFDGVFRARMTISTPTVSYIAGNLRCTLPGTSSSAFSMLYGYSLEIQ